MPRQLLSHSRLPEELLISIGAGAMALVKKWNVALLGKTDRSQNHVDPLARRNLAQYVTKTRSGLVSENEPPRAPRQPHAAAEGPHRPWKQTNLWVTHKPAGHRLELQPKEGPLPHF